MIQEDKELLLKDLCARLPYGVVIHFDEKTDQDNERLYGMRENGGKFLINDAFYIEEIKPYLFPLSSMTEEQKYEYYSLCVQVPVSYYEHGDLLEEIESFDTHESFNYLNANHFDYRDLIPMGLAIDATGKNIY